MIIAKNIEYLRLKNNYSQSKLAEMLGYKSFTTVQKWESGVSSPPLKVFIRLSELFGVDLDDFATIDLSNSSTNNYRKRFSKMVPVYGRIPAGIPMEAITDIDEFTPLSDSMIASRLEYFALRLRGESMSPKYHNDDIVIFEKQNVCKSGDECAVRLYGEEATFKKVVFDGNQVILKPLNPEFVTIQFDRNKIGTPLEIMGVACEIRRSV